MTDEIAYVELRVVYRSNRLGQRGSEVRRAVHFEPGDSWRSILRQFRCLVRLFVRTKGRMS